MLVEHMHGVLADFARRLFGESLPVNLDAANSDTSDSILELSLVNALCVFWGSDCPYLRNHD